MAMVRMQGNVPFCDGDGAATTGPAKLKGEFSSFDGVSNPLIMNMCQRENNVADDWIGFVILSVDHWRFSFSPCRR